MYKTDNFFESYDAFCIPTSNFVLCCIQAFWNSNTVFSAHLRNSFIILCHYWGPAGTTIFKTFIYSNQNTILTPYEKEIDIAFWYSCWQGVISKFWPSSLRNKHDVNILIYTSCNSALFTFVTRHKFNTFKLNVFGLWVNNFHLRPEKKNKYKR